MHKRQSLARMSAGLLRPPRGGIRWVATTGMAAVVVAACGSTSTASPPSTAKPPSTLSIGIPAPVETLDPIDTASVGNDESLLADLYATLVQKSASGKLEPDIATNWKLVNPTTWQFNLRKDVHFWNGDLFTASDVAYNIARVQNPANNSRNASYYADVTGVTEPSKFVADIHTKTPDLTLPDALSFFYLLDPSWVPTHSPATQAMGDGPYKLVSYNAESEVVMDANPTYFGSQPYFKTVTYVVLPSASAQLDAIESGQVDVMTSFSVDEISELEKDPSIMVGHYSSSFAYMIKINTLTSPTSNLDVRLAMNYAVNKAGIAKSILDGVVSPSPGELLQPIYQGYDPSLSAYPYDPAKAKSLLASAGYAHGLSVTFMVPTGTYPSDTAISEAVAQQLGQVGIKATIDELPFDTYLQDYVTKRTLSPVSFLGQSWATLTCEGLFGLFVSASPYAYWTDTAFTNAVNSALAATSTSQANADCAQAASIMRSQAPVIFLFPEPVVYAIRKGIAWTPNPAGWLLGYAFH